MKHLSLFVEVKRFQASQMSYFNKYGQYLVYLDLAFSIFSYVSGKMSHFKIFYEWRSAADA